MAFVQIIARRITQPWLMLDFLFRLSPLSRQQDEADRIINEYAQRVIQLKRRQVEQRRLGRPPEHVAGRGWGRGDASVVMIPALSGVASERGLLDLDKVDRREGMSTWLVITGWTQPLHSIS